MSRINIYKLKSSDAIKSSASNGWLMKWNLGDRWVKSPGYICNFLWDSYSEVIAYSLSKDLGIKDHLKYSLCIINIDGINVAGCESPNYINNNYTEVTLHKLIQLNYLSNNQYKGVNGYKTILKEIHNKLNVNLQSYIEDIILLDSIILNTDRNLWNISLLCNKQGTFIKCSIYDSGSSLGLTSFNEGEFFEECMYANGFRAQPFDIYFENQLKYIRNNRNFKLNSNKTKDIINYINNNFTKENNTYNVTNVLTSGQVFFIQDLLNKRIKTVINNKIWKDKH